jgi:trehalose synthase
MQEIDVRAAPLDRLESILAPGRPEQLAATAGRSRSELAGRVVWNVNATAHGGGVAEMLQGLLPYGRGVGVDTRWLVIDGDPEFFAITKRIHNALHGVERPGPGLGAAEHQHYESILAANLVDLQERVRAGDLVLLHDPQTAGLVDGVRATGAHVVWRSHIGRDDTNVHTDRGWAFLRGYLEHADAFVFSRRRYVPSWVPPDRVRVIEPSIDPFSTKNCELDDHDVAMVLARVGLVTADGDTEPVTFQRRDGTSGTVRAHSRLLGGAEPPPLEAPLVVQVSRWDRLKDMSGVLSAFAEHIAPVRPEVHLMLAGPDVSGVSDDPEGLEVLEDCRRTWSGLPASVRDRCHLASIPMDDADENAIIVNALQRHATVVVQKSLAEGFGLTVAEALWKARPVLASAVGGIQDQIVDGRDGLLLAEPENLPAFAARLAELLDDPALGARLGRSGHERVRAEFLGDRHLTQYLDLFEDLLDITKAPVLG